MKPQQLPLRRFIWAILATSGLHALAFSAITSLFLLVAFEGQPFGSVYFPYICIMYISSYACHELGHYVTAARLHAQPILWIGPGSVSVLSNPIHIRHGRKIAVAGPLAALAWLFAWWAALSLLLPALRFAALIPASMLASAHLGSLLPVFSDGKALTRELITKRRYS